MSALVERLRGGVVAAVPAGFRDSLLDEQANRQYALSLAAEALAGVAVWAHTGRGRLLTAEQRRTIIQIWREASPGKVLVAGVHDPGTAIDARRRGADAILVFPEASDSVRHHERLSRELPAIVFWLYDAAGGVAYDDATLHRLLDLPQVIGIKVATLDSVMTFQHLATIMRSHPDKLLITGEDRFLGYSVTCGAESALIGLAASVPALPCELFRAYRAGDAARFLALTRACDQFAAATFRSPMDGYVARMLWAAIEEGRLPECVDPWAPALDQDERQAVREAVQRARAAVA